MICHNQHNDNSDRHDESHECMISYQICVKLILAGASLEIDVGNRKISDGNEQVSDQNMFQADTVYEPKMQLCQTYFTVIF